MSLALLFSIEEGIGDSGGGGGILVIGDSGGGGGIFLGSTEAFLASEKKRSAFSCSLKQREDELVFNCDNTDVFDTLFPSSEVVRDDLLVDNVTDRDTFAGIFDFERLIGTVIAFIGFLVLLYSAFKTK